MRSGTARLILQLVLSVLASILAAPTPSEATAIIGLWTPTSFSIAADTLIDAAGAAAFICKLRRVNRPPRGVAVFGFAGAPYSGPLKWSAYNLVGRTLEQHSIVDSADAIVKQLPGEYSGFLSRLRTHDRKEFDATINRPLQVIMAAFEQGYPDVIALDFRGRETPTGIKTSLHTRLECPGKNCKPPYAIFLGVGLHAQVEWQRNNMNGRPPQQVVADLVQLEIDRRTPGVGGSVDAWHLDARGLSMKRQCKL